VTAGVIFTIAFYAVLGSVVIGGAVSGCGGGCGGSGGD